MHKKGEIATVLTIGALIVLGISTLISSSFLKNKQTLKTKAAESCDDLNWFCAGECADPQVRTIFSNNAGNWKNKKAKNCKINTSQCNTATSCDSAGTEGLPNPTKAPNAGGFHLGGDVYANKTGQGISFDIHVKFNFDGCDGDIKLFRGGQGGQLLGVNGWNKDGGPFVYSPRWTGPPIVVAPGGHGSVTYTGTVDNCPNSTKTLVDSLTCNYDVSSTGAVSVSGAGCDFKNQKDFASVVPPPANPINPATSTTQDCSAGNQCRYSQGSTCYRGYSTDPSKSSGFNINCSYQNKNGKVCPGAGEEVNCNDGRPLSNTTSAACTFTKPSEARNECDKEYGYEIVKANCYRCRVNTIGVPAGCSCVSGTYQGTNCSDRLFGTPCTTTSPVTTSIPPPISTNGYCPDADPKVAYCAKDQPAKDWVKTYMSCFNFWDSCWVPPGKDSLYPTPVPEDWTAEVDDGFGSWRDWITHTQVCDAVGEKSFLGINGIITKNCRDPEYLQGYAPGKVTLKYKKNAGIKTMLCQFGGNGRCIDLP